MRVLFVTASYLPESVGGVELHVAGLARSLREAGHEVAVLARSGDPELPHLATRRDEVEGVTVVRLGNTFEHATTLQALIADGPLADAAMEVVRDWAPDVVHVHHLTCLSTALLDRLREAGVPTVMTLHDFWMGCPRGQRITADLVLCPEIRLAKCVSCLRELWPHLLGAGRAPDASPEERDAEDQALLEAYHADIRRGLTGVDALLTPSAFMARMYEAYGLPEGSVRVVENGLPLAPWSETPRRPRTGGPVRIGFIGSVLPSKGVHLLLQAFRRLGDPSDLRLDVWGEVLPFHNDRTYGERLEALREGFEHAVTLHGRYENEDLPAILGGLDVVVVPSIWYEAFCLTIREAFLAGVAVVASNHGAMAEAIEDGVTGLLFEAGDPESLAACITRLAADPVLRESLAAGGAARVRDEADAAVELTALYQQLASGGGAS
jgi:glycosyltransferase involved in cell wall biosynthesis